MANTQTFDKDALLQNILSWARTAGRTATRPVLLMWFVLNDPNTSTADKAIIIGALSSFVVPINALSARHNPILAAGAAIAAYYKVSKNVTPAIEASADALLDKWFPQNPC